MNVEVKAKVKVQIKNAYKEFVRSAEAQTAPIIKNHHMKRVSQRFIEDHLYLRNAQTYLGMTGHYLAHAQVLHELGP